MEKYGELFVLGYNGRKRERNPNKFELCKRHSANGVKRFMHSKENTPHCSQAVLNPERYAISYSRSNNEAVVVEYIQDEDTDMFQIGRCPNSSNDFIVRDTIPGNKTREREVTQSMISRFACRILVNRKNPTVCRIYAAGFNACRNIFLGEKATKWQENDVEIDGLTTNGVLISHPKTRSCDGEVVNNVWLETSVGGKVFLMREIRSAQQRGQVVDDETNVLKDGTLIDLCGATLLWRSAEGLTKSPSKRDLERQIGKLIMSLPIEKNQPCVYLNCGHVLDSHNWGQKKNSDTHKCPICLELGPVANILPGMEPAFYIDRGRLTRAFNPCGHIATLKTVRYWANVTIPHGGTNSYHAICPFCASALVGRGYIKLILD